MEQTPFPRMRPPLWGVKPGWGCVWGSCLGGEGHLEFPHWAPGGTEGGAGALEAVGQPALLSKPQKRGFEGKGRGLFS